MLGSITRKLVFTALVLVALTLASLDYVAERSARQRETEALVERLIFAARWIVAVDIRPEQLRSWSRDVGVQADLFHQTGLDLSSAGPEILEALGGRLGKTVRDGWCYVAVPALSSGERVVVRLSAPLEFAPSGRMRAQLAFITLLSALAALFIAFLAWRSLAARISRLKDFAEALLDAPAPGSGPASQDELGALERTLSRVAAQLSDLFDRWRLESSRSEAILSSMAEGVLAVDRELRVVFCNHAVTRTMGLRSPVKERTPLIELIRDAEVIHMLSQVIRSGETIKRNFRISAANNRTFEVQAAPFVSQGGSGALAIFYDMTDLERLEQVRKDFVANVSHELRTPLAAIMGYSDTLLDGALEDHDHNRKFIEVIRTNAIRLNSIASDLLVLSELESGRGPGQPEPILLRELVESAMGTIGPEARGRGVKIIKGHIADATVLGHRHRLEQALLNLLVNAVKFNREGGEVRVEVRNGDGQVHIEVSDNGVGIPSQDLPRIFERFYRVDKARSRQVGGTGLGLSIVRHVIEPMDGKVTVVSQLGKGSTFTIVLPTFA
jgi:two-component system phosphate regulon sensor histidine kinase PhoR